MTATACAPRCSGRRTATPASPPATRAGCYLPVVATPVYGYQVTNVEAQLRNTSSLLHWTRRMIEVRKQNPAFGLGGFHDLGGNNPSVFCLRPRVRRRPGAVREQPVALRRSRSSWTCGAFEGVSPVEMLGGAHFPRIGELPYLLTLGGHGFYWFRLPHPEQAT